MEPSNQAPELPPMPEPPPAPAGDLIERDPAAVTFIQARAEVDYATIDEYARLMADGVTFDPALALRDPEGHIFVWDGYHRGQAAAKAGRLLRLRVRPGCRAEAAWLALTANQRHGIRRTRRDKRRVVELALKHPNGASLSDREIARHCGVTHKTVGRIRRELAATGEIPQSETRTVTRTDGTSYELDTSNIGAAPPAAPQEIEMAVCRWLIRQTGAEAEPKIEILRQIVEETPEGAVLLEMLANDETLPRPHRPEDLRRACCAVLTQIERQQGAVCCVACGTTEPGEAGWQWVAAAGGDIRLCIACAPDETEGAADEDLPDAHYLKQRIVLRLPPIIRQATMDQLLVIDNVLDEVEEHLPS